MFVFIWPEKKSNDRVTQNRFCVDELSDESISCSQAMCLWTSTFVVKPMLLISTHWLLWRCEPLGLCSETFRNPEGNLFACRCVASFPLIPQKTSIKGLRSFVSVQQAKQGRPGHHATRGRDDAARRRCPGGKSAEVGPAACPLGFLLNPQAFLPRSHPTQPPSHVRSQVKIFDPRVNWGSIR